MKSEKEIKEFIDSKEVITQRELNKFIYGYTGGDRNSKFRHWWDYVLKTKDWKKLKEYRDKKITSLNNGKFETFKKLYDKDERLRMYGTKRQKKLLLNIYGLDYGRTTLAAYNKKLKNAN